VSLHVTVQEQQAVHTAGGNFVFTYKICYSHSHQNYSHSHSHSQLVAPNYFHSHGNPVGIPWESHGNPMWMGIPIPMHTSTALVLRSYLASVLPSLVCGSTCLNPASSSSSIPRTQPRSCDRCFDYITPKRTIIHVLTFMINIFQLTKECKNELYAHCPSVH